MSEELPHLAPESPEPSIKEQLERAVRDLWTMMIESGEDYVVFMDRRRLQTRVDLGQDGLYHISWEPEDDGPWIVSEQAFDALREAAFRGYQGPH